MASSKSQIALKPYLDSIEEICDPLSKKELTNLEPIS
jgi:hypothetical protein